MAKNDGGPAFPCEVQDGETAHGTPKWEPCAGMTLRDYFAGQALAGMLANTHYKLDLSLESGVDDSFSARAYRVADAMLAARETE